jgi:hypothetical protein
LTNSFLEYFRCPEPLVVLEPAEDLDRVAPGFFRFGQAICYGRQSAGASLDHVNATLCDVSPAIACHGGRVRLPFEDVSAGERRN